MHQLEARTYSVISNNSSTDRNIEQLIYRKTLYILLVTSGNKGVSEKI